MFSTLSNTKITIFVIFNLSSANALNFGLVQNFVVGDWVKRVSVYHFQHYFSYVSVADLTYYQTTNFRLFQTEDDNFKLDENGRKLYKRVENTVGKGKIAHYTQFLLFPKCFQRACFPGVSKGVIEWEWINPFPNKPWCLQYKSFENTVEKEKLLVTSNFSFSHCVFYLFE